MDLNKRIVGGLSLLLLAGGSGASQAATPPLLSEVYELLRTNLTELPETELNRAAVQGLINELAPRAKLLSGQEPSNSDGDARERVDGVIFHEAFGYLRIKQVAAGVEKELAHVYDSLASTNKMKGIVIDLRFAGGDDYAAALATANWFIASEQALIDWGEGMKKSSGGENVLKVPVAVLVNRRTSGAAEALAAMLRYADVGLILGTNTAGTAALAKEFTLSTGQRLRVSGTPIRLGDGKPLPASGLKADIEVAVSEEEEQAYLADAYKAIPKPGRSGVTSSANPNAPGTNRPPRRRINEAELVRMQREGQEIDLEPVTRPLLDSGKPVVLDPALGRALDLLKGLSVVQSVRSP
jgi:hypothetical protein